ncbi:hypothetical protein ACFOYU_16945 [Microvirga sp. GCM10011540]|uniref:hypothetical protein n=1 Tax=Microvirga sp. GCM10011540 TaxID=3317338 RepID=UPI00361F05A2
MSRLLDQEFDPSLPDELPPTVALLLEANPFPFDPMLGELTGSPWATTDQEAMGPGNRIPRAVVADDLGNRILDLLWQPIEETDAPRMRRRWQRFVACSTKFRPGPQRARCSEGFPPAETFSRISIIGFHASRGRTFARVSAIVVA